MSEKMAKTRPFTRRYQLPSNVFRTIFDFIAAASDNDSPLVTSRPETIETLQACSLTCRAFRPLSQRHLLRTIFIEDWQFSNLVNNLDWFSSSFRVYVQQIIFREEWLRHRYFRLEQPNFQAGGDWKEPEDHGLALHSTRPVPILPDALRVLASMLPNVKSLGFHKLRLTSIIALPDLAPCLGPIADSITHLEFSECGGSPELYILKFISTFSKLESLSIYADRSVNELGPRAAEYTTPSLLYVAAPPGLTNLSIQWSNFTATVMNWLVESNRALRSLSISGRYQDLRCATLYEELIPKILSLSGDSMQHLDINLRPCSGLGIPEMICRAIRTQKKLTSLTLSGYRPNNSEWVLIALDSVRSPLQILRLHLHFSGHSIDLHSLDEFKWDRLQDKLLCPQFRELFRVEIHSDAQSIAKHDIIREESRVSQYLTQRLWELQALGVLEVHCGTFYGGPYLNKKWWEYS